MQDKVVDKKITPRLAAQAARSDSTQAVVELTTNPHPYEGLSRSAKIQAEKADFEAHAVAVESAIRKAGGEVLEKAWINSTLLVRLPNQALNAVANLSEVCLIDAPGELQPE